jgi:hypothetical protein
MAENNILELIKQYLKQFLPKIINDAVIKETRPAIRELQSRINDLTVEQLEVRKTAIARSIKKIYLDSRGHLMVEMNDGELLDLGFIILGGATKPPKNNGDFSNLKITGFVNSGAPINGTFNTIRTDDDLNMGNKRIVLSFVPQNDTDVINKKAFDLSMNNLTIDADKVNGLQQVITDSIIDTPINTLAIATGPLDMGTNTIVKLANGVDNTDAVNLGQMNISISNAKYTSASITDFAAAVEEAAKPIPLNLFANPTGSINCGGFTVQNVANAQINTEGVNLGQMNTAIANAEYTSANITDFTIATQTASKLIPLNQFAIPTANINFNSKILTAVANGVGNSDGTNVGQMNTAINTAISNATYTSAKITDFTTAAQTAAKLIPLNQFATTTGSLNCGGFTVQNVANAVANTQAVNLGQMNTAINTAINTAVAALDNRFLRTGAYSAMLYMDNNSVTTAVSSGTAVPIQGTHTLMTPWTFGFTQPSNGRLSLTNSVPTGTGANRQTGSFLVTINATVISHTTGISRLQLYVAKNGSIVSVFPESRTSFISDGLPCNIIVTSNLNLVAGDYVSIFAESNITQNVTFTEVWFGIQPWGITLS